MQTNLYPDPNFYGNIRDDETTCINIYTPIWKLSQKLTWGNDQKERTIKSRFHFCLFFYINHYYGHAATFVTY